MARSISQSVGQGGVNRRQDVITVQELINANLGKLTPLAPLKVDGLNGKKTIGAIEEFQRRVVRMRQPDGRVDPRGKTLQLLNQGAPVGNKPAAPAPAAGGKTFTVTFKHGNKTPSWTSANGGTNALYESTVTVSGPKTGTFRGSIYPDDMSVKGRIKDGTYDLHIGWHKRSRAPNSKDLVARTQGFRAALIVNLDKSVPVISNNPSKTTSSAIHVHNGFNSKRYSEGCQTLHPQDWAKFIKLFLDQYPTLQQWQATNTYVGVKIGKLVIQP